VSKLRDKLDYLYKTGHSFNSSADRPESPDQKKNIRQRLEQLVESKLSQRTGQAPARSDLNKTVSLISTSVSTYPLGSRIGPVELGAWMTISGHSFSILFPDHAREGAAQFKRPLFLDTETTGLSGGAGTLPFMIGSGFFVEGSFTVKVMTLLDPAAEQDFLKEWCQVVDEVQPDCLVTFNGKAYDLPLIESRFILNRLPFKLDQFPHLDFLYPARTLWGWTFPSRRLGILGEELLGLSREGDIAGEFIPSLYFNYLRLRRFSLLEPVIRHNALDIVGLAALVVLAASYLQASESVNREGEYLGLALLHERIGNGDATEECLIRELSSCSSEKVKAEAIKRLAICKKKRKLYQEAALLWRELLPTLDKRAFNELIVHTAYREGDMESSQALIKDALKKLPLTMLQRKQLEDRLHRLQKNRDDQAI